MCKKVIMSEMNTVAKLYGKEDLRLEQFITKHPEGNEVLISLERCGVCGTDVHLWKHGGAPGLVVRDEDDVVLGHESAGVVVKTGPDVKTLKPGDRVVPELGVPCRKCELCKHGRYNLCKPYSLGGFANYLLHPEDFCHKLPNHVSFEAGALCEPLAVAVRATRRSGVVAGSTVLITGAGPVGLLCLLTAKFCGASHVCVTDMDKDKLDLAKTLGATHTVIVQGTADHTASLVRDTIGHEADLAIEASGVPSALLTSIMSVKKGGVVTVVGIYNDDITMFPAHVILRREIDVRGVFSYTRDDYKAAVAMVASGRVDPMPIISHTFKLIEVQTVLQLLNNRSSGINKIIIDTSK